MSNKKIKNKNDDKDLDITDLGEVSKYVAEGGNLTKKLGKRIRSKFKKDKGNINDK